ncbi:MAG: hypothetical protein KDD70_16840, partial [Bdellovibrionales bacterium]|nr:hypothetical protein [Bdellovibrionales bacterium]
INVNELRSQRGVRMKIWFGLLVLIFPVVAVAQSANLPWCPGFAPPPPADTLPSTDYSTSGGTSDSSLSCPCLGVPEAKPCVAVTSQCVVKGTDSSFGTGSLTYHQKICEMTNDGSCVIKDVTKKADVPYLMCDRDEEGGCYGRLVFRPYRLQC